jgi:hypothetical protein
MLRLKETTDELERLRRYIESIEDLSDPQASRRRSSGS